MTLDERAALLGLSMADVVRAGGYTWLTDLLVSTRHARARLARWVAAGRPAPNVGEICILGERGRESALQAAARRLPAPTAWHAVRHVILLLIGREYRGICARLPALRGRNEAPFVVAIDARPDDQELQTTFAHEAAHAFLSRPAARRHGPVVTLADAQGYERVRLATPADEWSDCPEAIDQALDEWRVAALCAQWGFCGAGADVGRYAAGLQRIRALRAARRRA